MKTNLILACIFLALSIAVAFFVTPWVFLLSIAFSGLALWAAYIIGTRRSLIVDEDEIPRDIYQLVAIVSRDTEKIAVLRNSKRKRFAVGSLGKDFHYFVIKSDGDEKFFVPKAICPLKATTATETSAVCT